MKALYSNEYIDGPRWHWPIDNEKYDCHRELTNEEYALLEKLVSMTGTESNLWIPSEFPEIQRLYQFAMYI
jgi:hypothetical protein